MDEQAVLEELEGGATTGATLLVSTGMEMTLNEAVVAGIAIAQPIDDSGAAAANTSGVPSEATTGGPIRARKTKRMDRRLSHWKCTYCRHEMLMSERAAVCEKCNGSRQELRDADAAGRETARAAARKGEARGRALNQRGAGGEQVPRVAQGVFEQVRHDALVEWEVNELEKYAGSANYLQKEEGMLGIMESFFVVQYRAQVSLLQGSKRAQITGAHVAKLFNTLGRRTAAEVAGEDTFPMGGYFNEFRRSGVTVKMVQELQTIVKSTIARGGGDAASVTRNARTFAMWYKDKQNKTAATAIRGGGSIHDVIMRAAKVYFTSMYAPGGRLHVDAGLGEDEMRDVAFQDFEIPAGVVRDVLNMLFSSATRQWLKKAAADEARDVARGFRSQVATDGSGTINLYAGTSMVQFRKTLCFVLNASGNLAAEDTLARRAFFVAMVTVTRHKTSSNST